MKQLLILSGKGGTGKTTVAAAFIRLSKARASADCDVDAPNLHLVMDRGEPSDRSDYFGMPKAEWDAEKCVRCGACRTHCRFGAISGGADFAVDPFACEGCGVCEAVCPSGAMTLRPAVAGELMLYTNGDVFSTAQLKMGSGTSGMLVTEVKKRMRSAAAQDTQLAIIDGSPGIGCPVIASLSGVDMALIVAEPSVSGVSDMERIVKTAASFRTPVAVCVNKHDTNPAITAVIEEFCREKGLPFIGRIPFDTEAVTAVNEGRTIADRDCPSGRAVREVFRRTMALLFDGTSYDGPGVVGAPDNFQARGWES